MLRECFYKNFYRDLIERIMGDIGIGNVLKLFHFVRYEMNKSGESIYKCRYNDTAVKLLSWGTSRCSPAVKFLPFKMTYYV